MLNLRLCFAAVVAFAALPLAAQEAPPYSPPIAADLMTTYADTDLGFTIRYPVEFQPRTLQDLQTVMDRGHHSAYGTAPESDPEHLQAMKCMHTLLYATSSAPDTQSAQADQVEDSPDTIMVVDFDRFCLPKNLKGDNALTQIAGSVLHVSGMTQLVPQTWFEGGGGRRIHSGMAAESFPIPASASNPARQVTLAIAASAFEQKNHWILVVYINGTRDEKMHKAFGYTAVTFEDSRPVILFPFLLGKMNVVK